MKVSRSVVSLTAALMVSALPVAAQITYVDAVENGNTIQADGGAMVTNGDNNGIDDIWRARAFGNGATIFEANGSTAGDANTEDTPRLKTSVSGLPVNTYNVFVYFWSDSSPWRIGASLTDEAGDLPVFVGGGAPEGSPLPTASLAEDFLTTVLVSEGGRTLWQASLGTVSGTGFDVFIDNDSALDRVAAGGNNWNYRTWYDGVGYSVVPEPTSLSLIGLAALAGTLVLRRKA